MNFSIQHYYYYVIPALIFCLIHQYFMYVRAYQKIHEFVDPFIGEKKEKRTYYKKHITEILTLFCFKTERFAQQKINRNPTLYRYTAPFKDLRDKVKAVREDMIIEIPQNLPSLLSIFPMDRIRDDDDLQILYEEWCTYEDLVTSYHTVFRFSLT